MKIRHTPFQSNADKLRICLTAETIEEVGKLVELSKRIPKAIAAYGWLVHPTYLWIAIPLKKRPSIRRRISNQREL